MELNQNGQAMFSFEHMAFILSVPQFPHRLVKKYFPLVRGFLIFFSKTRLFWLDYFPHVMSGVILHQKKQSATELGLPRSLPIA